MNDLRSTLHTAGSALFGWAGTAASVVLLHANALASLIAALLAGVVSVYGIRVAIETIRLRRIEAEKVATELCRECQDGYPPTKCPKPKRDRKPECPHYNEP